MLKKYDRLPPRFDRKAWLSEAMEVLARQGQAKLRIENLAKKLGVTKGSFYHHFEGRDDFVLSLLDFWATEFTDSVIKTIGTEQPADKRLLRLMQLIEEEGLDRYDIAFRSWAAQDEAVAEKVREIDVARYRFVRSLFAELGFKGIELRERVRTWLVFYVANRSVYIPESPKNIKRQIVWRYAFFTSKQPKE